MFIWRRFETQANLTPGALAVVDDVQHLTYEQLCGRAERISSRLVEGGFEHGDIAAIVLGRTGDAIAAMLGVLRAGGAYLPVDPQAPRKHLDRILADSAARTVLTTRQLAASLKLAVAVPPDPGGTALPSGGACRNSDGLGLWEPAAPWFNYVDDMVVVAGAGSPVAAQSTGPDDLAYVIYTSGSTGAPKGAMNEHRGVLHLVDALHGAILSEYGPALRIALVAPFVFDPSVQQIFSALLHGHTLFIVPDEARREARGLAEYYLRHSIDVSDGTPSHLKILARAPRAVGTTLPVKHFLIGGEILRYADVTAFWRRFSGCGAKITNLYGTAECAVDSSFYTIERDSAPADGIVPIGRPLGDTRLYVVDAALQPIGVGVRGELCIGGDGVGRGYLGDADLTSQKFRSNPFEPGTRLYRTGDAAALRPDGLFEVHGRLDGQLKIRGFRVEPAEIEAKILAFRDRQARSEAGVAGTVRRCVACLLTIAHPKVTIGDDGVCSVCRWFERYRDHILPYFKAPEDFDAVVAKARRSRRGPYDCILLFSGGKDSSYVLYRLVAKGLRVLTFTFDNGFISKGAFDNIARITEQLGVEHVTMTTPRMLEVFAESLRIDSTVCSGCFRILTSLSTGVAVEQGINVVITGLSRGQIFDTKLAQLFAAGVFDPEDIDRQLVLHRKMYHARHDHLGALIDAPVLPETLDGIHFIDYFRYDPATVHDVMAYLTQRDKRWSEPGDTGFCSTNCLINDVGIYAHQAERGYHNYAAPLSWDVRLGVISRGSALEKLQEGFDVRGIRSILRAIDYTPRVPVAIEDVAVVKTKDDRLVAYIVASGEVAEKTLKSFLKSELPEYMVPSRIFQVEELPLTTNGKVDWAALLGGPPSQGRPAGARRADPEIERRLLGIWREVMESDDVAPDDDFTRLGGTSLQASVITALVEDEFEVQLPLAVVFDKRTVTEMARLVESLKTKGGGAGMDQGLVRLRPGTEWGRNLFLIHDSSGRIDAVAELGRRLRREVTVWGVQASDRSDTREMAYSIEDAARAYIERILAVPGDGALRLGGWSFGGILAYEMARQLSGRRELRLLVVIDAEAPDAERWREVQSSFLRYLRDAFPNASAAVPADGNAEEECQRLLREIERDGTASDRLRLCTPASIALAIPGWENLKHDDLVTAIRRVARHVGALARYKPMGRARVAAEVFLAAEGRTSATGESWASYVEGPVHIEVITGDHRQILVPPNVQPVINRLNSVLGAGG